MSWRCPCCDLSNVDGEGGEYEICPRCGWEDDPLQSADPDALGANHQTLNSAHRLYKATSRLTTPSDPSFEAGGDSGTPAAVTYVAPGPHLDQAPDSGAMQDVRRVVAYFQSANVLTRVLRKVHGTEATTPHPWNRASKPRSGALGRGIQYRFHGRGCAFTVGTLAVDIDFDHTFACTFVDGWRMTLFHPGIDWGKRLLDLEQRGMLRRGDAPTLFRLDADSAAWPPLPSVRDWIRQVATLNANSWHHSVGVVRLDCGRVLAALAEATLAFADRTPDMHPLAAAIHGIQSPAATAADVDLVGALVREWCDGGGN